MIFVFLKMLQHFQIEYHHEDIDFLTRLVLVPDKPLRFQLVDLWWWFSMCCSYLVVSVMRNLHHQNVNNQAKRTTNNNPKNSR